MTQGKQKSNSDHPSRGAVQRDRILSQAIKTASAQGLEALTIGRMAAALKMSKSGLFAHFGSKEKLQLATLEQAKQIFDRQVLQPVEESTGGIERLWSLCDLWLKHLENGLFPSGYFFTGAFLEYGQRKGPLANRLQEQAKGWMKAIQRSIQQAQRRKELNKEPSAERMAFELNAMLVGAYWSHSSGNWDAYSEARFIVFGKLQDWATDKIKARALRSVNTWLKYLKARAKRTSGK
jgi:AcrR family transcriptional regulator